MSWMRVPLAALLVVASPVARGHVAAAQGVPRTLDLGAPPGDSARRGCATDSIVTAALAAFNSPAAVHDFGGGSGGVSIPAGLSITGSLAVHDAVALVAGTVQGDIVVLNGSARILGTGVVNGNITVIGGNLVIDERARVTGKTFSCEQRVGLTKSSDNTLVRSKPGPSLGSLQSQFHFDFGQVRLTPHLGIHQYNRVEGLPIDVGVNVTRPLGSDFALRGEAFAVVRTAHDPSNSRATVGWQASGAISHQTGMPAWLGVSGGWTIRPTSDQPFSPLESGLSAIILRRDYADWYLNRGVRLFGGIRPLEDVRVAGSIEVSRQNSVQAVDAFSLFRGTDPWRPNPLIDDGKYTTKTVQVTWDARDEREHPLLTWYARAELQNVSSSELTPVSIPTLIRDALPTSGYSATTIDVDLRAFLRLDPEQRIGVRLSAGGYANGDPLTIQRRRAAGSNDPLIGYGFRAVNCDRRRKVDPATPALCDRNIALQAEYRRVLPIDIGTRVGGYRIGLRNPELVVLGDIGSAWLVGDSAGRVPKNRIQSVGEWRTDIGVGIKTGAFGLYLAKALADPLPVRLTLLFTPRF